MRNDLFRIRIRIFYFWIADPDPTRVKGLASHYHVGDCVTTSKDDKIVPEKIKNLIKIFNNKRC